MKFLFDFLVPGNLVSTLLKPCKLILPSVRFSGLHDGLILRTSLQKKEFTAICCALHRNELHTGILNSGYLLSRTCRQKLSVFSTQIFLHFDQFYFYSRQVCNKRLANWAAITDTLTLNGFTRNAKHGFNSWKWSNLAWNSSSSLTIYFSILSLCGLQLPLRETPWFSFRHWETDRKFLTMFVFEKC